MTEKKLLIIVGARPQFIKHTAAELAFKYRYKLVSIHTGQHYDRNMSDIFYEQLKISPPDYLLNIGSESHGIQTGLMMQKIEPIVIKENPNAIIVYGDTNSTLAGALVGAKLNIPIIHIEAGLRGYNNLLPEEINRVITDKVSTLLFTPTQQGVKNLVKENIKEGVYEVGDIMCDMVRIARELNIINKKADYDKYYYVTIHRPYNTDDKKRLFKILELINSLDLPVYFSLHPRTKSKIELFGGNFSDYNRITFLDPLPYFENLQMQYNSKAVITDSGGVQKEAYILKKKCITIRSETEWTETLSNNWNILIFDDLSLIKSSLAKSPGAYKEDIYGDGRAAEKMLKIIELVI